MKNFRYNILLSWNQPGIAFPHQFKIEFAQLDISNGIDTRERMYKKAVNEFRDYLNENFGEETVDWFIAKHNGNYNFGSAIILGFRNTSDASYFYLIN